MKDKFFQVPITTQKTSEGDVDFPILYFDTSCVTAFFLCDMAKVKEQLADVPLEPGLIIRKKAVVAIAFYEYRDTSIGPYNEVGVALPVVRDREKVHRFPLLDLYSNPEKRTTGFYVIDLPVTTAAANAAGREMWGLPKFVTEIPFELSGRNFSSAVMDPETGKPIVTLEGKMGFGIPTPPMHLKLYSYVDSVELATSVNVRYGSTLRTAGSMKLSVGDSSHPMAQRLRALGLNGATPSALNSTNNFQSRLNLGVPLK